MKFTVNTIEFNKAVERVSKTLYKGKQLPAIENIKVEVADNTCILTSTNLEITTITKIKTYDIYSKESFVFSDTKTLLKAIKFYKDPELHFEVENGNINIQCGGKKLKQRVLDVNDFPTMPEVAVENSNQYSCELKDLKERFDRIKYAAAKVNECKPILTGIHFNEFDMVTCDGYRLAINKDTVFQVKDSFTVPQDALKVVSDVLNNNIKIRVNKKHISISDNDTEIISRLLEGDFFKYNEFIQKYETEVTVDVKEFIENLKYLQTFQSDKKLPVCWLNNKLVYRDSTGVYESNINIQNKFEKPYGFNSQFMLDSLTQFKSDKIIINMGSPTQPITIKNDSNNTALVMPIGVPTGMSELFNAA